MFCYLNDGLAMRSVEADYTPQKGEVLFPDYATTQQLALVFPGYSAAVQDAEKVKNNEQIYAELASLDIVKIRHLADVALGNGTAPITIEGKDTTPLAQLQAAEEKAAKLRQQINL